ncbi:MarR family winged helix-turn-helix transcriptional regulator [Leptotrichia sp. oral taxon 847]|uniref:MarR family winged helix-turn-helix transcriptional regulator n=1 Tax=Leptotrichia sp. oral taxon 847 TaxID=1785996 RepID=UPI0007682D52|nr:MarR family transcriptional regulator [Leptotrichia sp. oral taxon 847]AMD94898.1 MarR family transcriptional regulator [Leptotrichia sp. oral taxon 847]
MFTSKYKDNSEKSTGLLFMRVYNKWHSMIKKELKKMNLTHPQFVVLASLAYLSQNGNEVTQVMISKLSGIDVMTISQILSLLEKHNFVKRKEHSRDTRAKAVILNKKGEEILQKAVPLVEQIDENFFEKLDTDEGQFKHFLVRLNEE